MDANELIVGIHGSFDQGPPFSTYDIFHLEANATGVAIERMSLIPAAVCTERPTIVNSATTFQGPLSDLFGDLNVCSAPDDVPVPAKVRGHHTQVRIKARCGDQDRVVGIYEDDPFLKNLNYAMERHKLVAPAHSVLAKEVASGSLDSLLEGAPHKLSALYAQLQSPLPVPTVVLQDMTFPPISYTLPKYPLSAVQDRIEGKVELRFEVNADGVVSAFSIISGDRWLRRAVESEVKRWIFPSEAAGRRVTGSIVFRTNCPGEAVH